MRSNAFTYAAPRKTGGILRAAFALSLLLVCGEISAQEHPERKHIRAGNKDYEALNYGSAEGDYRSAMGKTPNSYEAAFNLADALYKQERYEEAAGILGELAKRPVLPAEMRAMIADQSQREQFITPEQRAKTMYNLGNTQFQQQKLQEALESYKQSLILNPGDIEAKYNLAYVQKLLEQQQDDNQNNNDQNKDNQNQDNQNNDQNQQDQDQNDQGDQGDQDQSDQQQDGGEDETDGGQDEQQSDKPEASESQPQEATISKDDAEKMLQAIQSQEDKTREKMDEKKKAVVAPSGKNW